MSVRYPQVLSKCTKIFNSVTTSDDPVIEKVLLNVIKIIYNLYVLILFCVNFILPFLSSSLLFLSPLFSLHSLLKLIKIIVKCLLLMLYWLH